MTCIDDDLYLMTVSKIQRLKNEYDELNIEYDKIHNELANHIVDIRHLIIAEEKLLKKLEKRKLKILKKNI